MHGFTEAFITHLIAEFERREDAALVSAIECLILDTPFSWERRGIIPVESFSSLHAAPEAPFSYGWGEAPSV